MRLLRALPALLVLAAALAPGAPGAQPKTGDPRVDEAIPLRIVVGEKVRLCETGTIVCPAGAPMCDDPKVVKWSHGPGGLELEGTGAGETLCSAASSGQGLRRVYRVVVVEPERGR